MPQQTAVSVHACDPISQAGIVSQLRATVDVQVIEQSDGASVALVVADIVDPSTIRLLQSLTAEGCRPILVSAAIDDKSLFEAVEAGVCAVVRRGEATTANLVSAITAAADGGGALPADLLGRLLGEVGRLQRHVLAPYGLTCRGLSSREADVLRLVADGYDTCEIADQLSYSERTIKTVLHQVITRLNLRNRSHAVAYALREGLI